MVVYINDKETKINKDSLTIQDIIDKGAYNTKYFVVYLNGVYVPRMRHHRTKLNSGDKITIYPLVSGG